MINRRGVDLGTGMD